MTIPKISIITASFNNGELIEETIQSILQQGYPQLEYIIIDGGSTDNTLEIIKRYEKHISYWVSEPDKGIYDAMNKGLQKVTGDWINFMNIGDCFANKESLKSYAEFFKKEYALIYSDVFGVIRNGAKSYLRQEGLFKKEVFLNQMPHQAIFFNAAKTKEMLYDTSFKVAADLDLLVKIYFRYGVDSFKYISEPLVHYELGGFSAQNYQTLVKERYQIISKLPTGLKYINRLNFYRQRVFERLKT